jgi:hypothetical protein
LDCFLSPHPTVNIYIYREDKKKKKKRRRRRKRRRRNKQIGAGSFIMSGHGLIACLETASKVHIFIKHVA